MADHNIREAAESLMGSFSPPQARSISQSHSVNVITEDLAAGLRYSGRMSSIRRFFCLLVTFDLLFTCLVWLICVMLHGNTIYQIFESEVIHYSIKTSLFDIVMVAACRFTVLLLFYALLCINNWSIIALSTGCTCAFLIAKVFVYGWVDAKEPVYHVFLILTSFTLAWGEAWFLDFRVLPQELHAKHFLSSIEQAGSAAGCAASERTPLLAGARAARSAYAESTVNWFSPIETPETSPRPRRAGEEVILTQEQLASGDPAPSERTLNTIEMSLSPPGSQMDEGEQENTLSEQQLVEKYERMSRSYVGKAGWLRWMFNWDHTACSFNPEWLSIEEYKRLAEASVASCWRILRAPGWKLEKRGSHRGDVVESLTTKEFGKVFRFTGTVDCSAKLLYEDIRDNLTKMPEWNPTILQTDLIKCLGPGVDLSYQVTAGGGNGLITPRDFVTLRRVCRLRASGEIAPEGEPAEPHAYVSSGVSVECPGYPPVSQYVRGINKVGCWYLRPAATRTAGGGVQESCCFQWLFSCDLKGRMPQFVIDAAFSTVMLDNVKYIRRHVASYGACAGDEALDSGDKASRDC